MKASSFIVSLKTRRVSKIYLIPYDTDVREYARTVVNGRTNTRFGKGAPWSHFEFEFLLWYLSSCVSCYLRPRL